MDRDQRIRDRAYQIWQEEGCPEGKASEHWEQARRAIEREEGSEKTAKTPKSTTRKPRGRGRTTSSLEPFPPGANGEKPMPRGAHPAKPS